MERDRTGNKFNYNVRIYFVLLFIRQLECNTICFIINNKEKEINN